MAGTEVDKDDGGAKYIAPPSGAYKCGGNDDNDGSDSNGGGSRQLKELDASGWSWVMDRCDEVAHFLGYMREYDPVMYSREELAGDAIETVAREFNKGNKNLRAYVETRNKPAFVRSVIAATFRELQGRFIKANPEVFSEVRKSVGIEVGRIIRLGLSSQNPGTDRSDFKDQVMRAYEKLPERQRFWLKVLNGCEGLPEGTRRVIAHNTAYRTLRTVSGGITMRLVGGLVESRY